MQPTLTAPVRENLLAMQNTARMLSQTQTRLATGKKVNSALDNPAAFFQAKGLDDRAQALTQLLDSMSMAQSTVEAADNALSTISELVGQARGLAQQALQADGATATITSVNVFAGGNAGALDVTVDGVTTTVAIAAGDTAADFAANSPRSVASRRASTARTGSDRGRRRARGQRLQQHGDHRRLHQHGDGDVHAGTSSARR